MRRAVTRKRRGTSGSRVTGRGQRPKFAPSSPGRVTVARQPCWANSFGALAVEFERGFDNAVPVVLRETKVEGWWARCWLGRWVAVG